MEIRRGRFMLERSRRRLSRAQGTFKGKGGIGEAWLMLPMVCVGPSVAQAALLPLVSYSRGSRWSVRQRLRLEQVKRRYATGVSGVRECQMTSTSEYIAWDGAGVTESGMCVSVV